MLLAVDVGNTNTVLGLFEGQKLVRHWRLATDPRRTSDEYGVLVLSLLREAGLAPSVVEAVIIASVVPPLQLALTELSRRFFSREPLFVGPGTRTGMPILYDNPREVGADRIVNAVAAYERYHTAVIVIDLGTATTLDCVSARGEYLGGAIAPGVAISVEALFARASKLPPIEISKPERVIGRNTVASMQSGIVYGHLALCEGLATRMIAELTADGGPRPRVIATGGLAALLATESSLIESVDELLTLEGLRLIHQRNVGAGA
jgi:type III pantothenate kinase